ncbi:triose-phosphate transporter family-domain-containing protein [Mariannaea sp. PMI_226]|nr:triose-phosphate transporter family-domain-containing protein [Mariannaea sp. PMI_226]
MPAAASRIDPPPLSALDDSSTDASSLSSLVSDSEEEGDELVLPPPSPDHIQSTVSSASPALITPAASSTSSSSSAAPVPAVAAARSSPQQSGSAGSRGRGSGPRRSTVDEAEDEIEMEPMTGHRRRRSSLASSAGAQPGPSARSRNPNSVGDYDNAKISEETDADHYRNGDSGDESYSDGDLQDDEETGLTENGRRRRQRKRQRNTQLDQRIAREKNDLTAEERKEADRDVVKRLLVNGGLILLWYLFSLSISIYNKWMFSKDNLNFPFPLFTTSMHMVVQFFLSALVLYLIPSLRPQQGHNPDSNSSSIMTKFFYITRIGPCGAATGLDIGLGNTSLKFISLTFYTMCKSSSLAFVLLFAFVFRLEQPTWRLVAIIATMTLGVILMVFGEVEFELGGFVLVISAAFFSGFRWGLTQILLIRNPATSNPFSSIFFLTPVMFLVLISIAIPVEGIGHLIDGFKILSDSWGVIMAPLFLLFPGCLAFCMTASEFALLKRTSVVTLSIAGIFKEVVTITAATLIFHDQLTLINFIGLLTTIAAIAAYNYIKISKMRQTAQTEVHERHVADEDHFIIENRSSTSSSDAGRRGDDGPEEVMTADGDFQPLLDTTDNTDEHRTRRTD